jgi:hypothetical protein
LLAGFPFGPACCFFERGNARVLLSDGLLHRADHGFEFSDVAALRGGRRSGGEKGEGDDE